MLSVSALRSFPSAVAFSILQRSAAAAVYFSTDALNVSSETVSADMDTVRADGAHSLRVLGHLSFATSDANGVLFC